MTIYALPNRPDMTPSWIFNIDSALHYLIYYTAGYLFHERLTAEKRDLNGTQRILQLGGIVLLTGYTALVYMSKDILGNVLSRSIPAGGEIYFVIRALLLIMFHIVLAKLFAGIGKLHEVGAQTLWLCGNEFVVKRIFAAAADIVGVQTAVTSALSAVIYACIMIWFIYKVLMPFEQKIYQRLLGIVRLETNI